MLAVHEARSSVRLIAGIVGRRCWFVICYRCTQQFFAFQLLLARFEDFKNELGKIIIFRYMMKYVWRNDRSEVSKQYCATPLIAMFVSFIYSIKTYVRTFTKMFLK